MKEFIILKSFHDIIDHAVSKKTIENVQCYSLFGNCNYQIAGDIDLEQKTLEVPETSTLFFDNGGMYNGTLCGNNTKLKGNVRLDRLCGSFSVPIHSSYSTMENNLNKFRMLLGLNVKTLFLDEDFTLDFQNIEQTVYCTNIQNIIGEDVLIDVENTGSSIWLISATKLKTLSGMHFDCNGFALLGALAITKTDQDYISITNVSVENITNPSSQSSINGISINNFSETGDSNDHNCNIFLNNIYMSNLWQQGNNVITDGAGSITGIFVRNDACAFVNVRICNCKFFNMHCFGSVADESHIIYEDVAGIYADSKFMSNTAADVEPNNTIEISNIQGKDFGKRLVKTNSANVCIRNILGTNSFFDFLCLVGLNASDSRFKHAHVQNIHYEGVIGHNGTSNGSFTLETAMRFTTAENIVSKVIEEPNNQRATNDGVPTFYPVQISADDVVIRNLQMIGAQTIYLPGNKYVKFENVSYDDTVGISQSYSNGIIMPYLNASASFDRLKVRTENKLKLISCNYRSSTDNNTNIFIKNGDFEFANNPQKTLDVVAVDGANWEDNTMVHVLNLTLKDCIFHRSEQFRRFPFRKTLGRWILENIVFEYEDIPTSESATIALCGLFYINNDENQSLTVKDVLGSFPYAVLSRTNKPMLLLQNSEADSVATQISLSNIRCNFTEVIIGMYNVCWGEYLEATVERKSYTLFGLAQKGFALRKHSDKEILVWTGTTWVEPS